jgi:hypothetical protein
VAGRTICRAPGLDQGPFPEADALDAAGRLGTTECAAILALLDQDGLVIRTEPGGTTLACQDVTFRRPIPRTFAGRPAWQFVPSR